MNVHVLTTSAVSSTSLRLFTQSLQHVFLSSALILLCLGLGEVLRTQPAFLRVLLTPLHAAVVSPPVLAAVDPLVSEVPAALHLAWLLAALSSVLDTKTP